MKRFILGLIVLSLVFLIGASGCYGTQTTQTQTVQNSTQPVATASEQTTTPTTAPESTTPVVGTVAPRSPAENAVVAKTVSISGYAFNPTEVTINVGETVKWTNVDPVQHRIISDRNLFDSGSMGKDDTYKRTFVAPGVYAYHCLIHPSMTGTVIVQ